MNSPVRPALPASVIDRAPPLLVASRSALTLPVLAILVLHLAVRAYVFWSSPTVSYPESATLLQVGGEPVLSLAWWGAGSEPLTIPLLYRLAGLDQGAIVVLQWLLASAAWSVLAVVAARLVRTAWLQPVVAALVVTFALTREVAQWDRVVLGESIALSLVALLLAALLLYAERPRNRLLVAVLGLAALLAFTRDTNGYEVLFMAPVFAAAALLAARRRLPHVLAALACVSIFAAGIASAGAGQRWEYPFYNVLSLRILPDDAATAAFVAGGMPMNATLRARAGRGSGDNLAYYQNPDLAAVRRWVLADGGRVYVRYLLTDPGASIARPGATIGQWLSQRDVIRTYAPRAAEPLGGALGWAFPGRDGLALLAGAALGVAAACGLAVGVRRRWLVPLLVIAVTLAVALAIYHAEADEVARAELLPAAQLRIGLWLLLAMAVDALLVARLGGMVGEVRENGRRAPRGGPTFEVELHL